MINTTWQYRLRHLFFPTPAPPKPSLSAALKKYERALNQLDGDTAVLLPVLLARDEAALVWQRSEAPTAEMANQLFTLDKKLQKNAPEEGLALIGGWRNSFHPVEANWWWRLDEARERRGKEKDLLWELAAVTLFLIFTVPLVVDIIQRLWINVPDSFTVIGSSLILLVTASPFTKRGRDLTQWTFKRVSWLSARHHAKVQAVTAFIALLLVVAIRFVVLPQCARIYNNQGVAALEAGDLTAAHQQLQRAAAFNEDFSVGYYNLGSFYEEIAQPDEAIALYKEAVVHDLELSPAYNNLGRLYLQQGETERAITLLQAGLDRLGDGDSMEEMATRYQSLTHMGQAYYELGKMTAAATALEQATDLEAALDPAFYNSRPHYYLALAYQKLKRPSAEIAHEWDVALSYLKEDDSIGWETAVSEHLEPSQ